MLLNVLPLHKIICRFLFPTPQETDKYFFQVSLLVNKKLLRIDGLFFDLKEFEDTLPLHDIANSCNYDDQHEQTNTNKL